MMNGLRTPPRFVPTLTEVIEPGPDTVVDSSSSEVPPDSTAVDAEGAIAIGPLPLSDAEIFGLDEHVLDRVLQRIDRSLEDRLSDAVSAAVQAQLDAMVPKLRTEIESVLRKLVVESLAAELSENQGTAPFSRP